MRYLLAIIVAIFIALVMVTLRTVLDAAVTSAQQDIHNQTAYVLVGLIPIIPLILAIWFIRMSWTAIVHPSKPLKIEPQEASNAKKNSTSNHQVNDSPELKRYQYNGSKADNTKSASQNTSSKPLKRLN